MHIILNDASVLEVASVTLEPHIVLQVPDKEAFLSVWDRLSDENITKMSVYNGDIPIASYEDCSLIGAQAVIDEGITAHFYMIGTPVESVGKEYKDAALILTGELQ